MGPPVLLFGRGTLPKVDVFVVAAVVVAAVAVAVAAAVGLHQL